MDISKKVKKPVEAIQCTNNFSLLQRKMYNVLLANASGNLHPTITHRIAMRVLCNLMGYHSNDYKTIKQKFRELRRMDIEWDVVNEDGNKVWTNTSPLSLARVIEGAGICEYEFTPSLVPYLDRPAQYAKFSLAVQAKFKSSYGLALYENCERYKNIGYTRSFDIPTFRKLMGVGQEEYLEFFALKRRVINSAIKEVNLYADFEIQPEYKKNKRTVISIRFLIYKKQTEINAAIENLGQASNLDRLEENLKKYFGLKNKNIEQYIHKYGRSYIEQKVEAILNSDSFKMGLIKNMVGYLKTALAEDYQTSITSKNIIEKERRDHELKSNTCQILVSKLNELERDYTNYLSNNIAKLITLVPKEIKVKSLEEFKSVIADSVYHNLYQQYGINNVIIADHYINFIRKRFPTILISITSVDENLKELAARIKLIKRQCDDQDQRV